MNHAARALLVAALVVAAGGATAQGLNFSASSKSRSDLFDSQKRLLDSRLSQQYEGSSRLRPQTDGTDFAALPGYRGSYRGEYLSTARSAARKHGIPEDLFLRLVQQESGWNPRARSHKGAMGLAQLMPGTAQLLRVNPNDPVQNLDGGARYLRMMYDRFGNWRLALAAYNAGPLAVEKHKGVPPYRETRNYVLKIMGS